MAYEQVAHRRPTRGGDGAAGQDGIARRGPTTAYSRMLGQKVMKADGEVAKVQRQLHVIQWAVPALTGATLLVERQDE